MPRASSGSTWSHGSEPNWRICAMRIARAQSRQAARSRRSVVTTGRTGRRRSAGRRCWAPEQGWYRPSVTGRKCGRRQWRRPSLWCRAWRCGACPGENQDQLRRIGAVPRHSHLRSHGPRRHVDDLDCSRPQITCYNAQPDRRAVRRRACSAGMGGLRAISKAVFTPPRCSGLLTCRWHLFPGAWYRPVTANLTDKND